MKFEDGISSNHKMFVKLGLDGLVHLSFLLGEAEPRHNVTGLIAHCVYECVYLHTIRLTIQA